MRDDDKINQVIFADSAGDNSDSEEVWTASLGEFNIYSKHLPVPSVIKPTDVVCKNLLGTICGTDLQKIKAGNKTGQLKISNRRPGVLYLGHETVAEVTEIGTDVKEVSEIEIGDRVCMAEQSTCRAFNIVPECGLCSSGRPLHCVNKGRRKFESDAYGGWSQYFKRSCWQLYKVRPELSLAEAALLEPAATAWCAIQKISNLIAEHDKIAVFGTGIFGILSIRMIRLLCPKIDVTAFGISSGQGCFAKDAGAQFQLLGAKTFSNKDYENVFDYCIDCSGHCDIWEFSALTLKPNACLLAIGFLTPAKIETLTAISLKEIKILTTHGYTHSNDQHAFAVIEALLINGKLNVSDLLTHSYPRAQFTEAFDLAMLGAVSRDVSKNKAIRVGLKWSK